MHYLVNPVMNIRLSAYCLKATWFLELKMGYSFDARAKRDNHTCPRNIRQVHPWRRCEQIILIHENTLCNRWKTLSSFFGKLRSGASRTAYEANKIARVKKVEGEIAQIRKQIDQFQERLGEVTYLEYIHKEPQGQDAIDYIEQITILEEKLVTELAEMENIQAETFETAEQTTPSPDIKCPNCNKMNPATTKFCANCGTKLT